MTGGGVSLHRHQDASQGFTAQAPRHQGFIADCLGTKTSGFSCTGTKTPDLATFAAVLQRLAHGARVPLRYFIFSDRHRSRSGLLTVDRAWCARRLEAGFLEFLGLGF